MSRHVGWLAVLVACGSSSQPPLKPAATSAELLARVGDKPRGLADVANPLVILEAAASWVSPLSRPMFASCKIEPQQVTRLRVAVGEPLRLAAEIDGTIDAKAVTCLIGNVPGVTVVERQGGVAVEYQPASPTTTPLATDLLKRCNDGCAVLRLGPSDHPVWLSADLADRVKLTIAGAGLASAFSAFASAAQAIPQLAAAHVEASATR